LLSFLAALSTARNRRRRIDPRAAMRELEGGDRHPELTGDARRPGVAADHRAARHLRMGDRLAMVRTRAAGTWQAWKNSSHISLAKARISTGWCLRTGSYRPAIASDS
jgi:hypothetical protein